MTARSTSAVQSARPTARRYVGIAAALLLGPTLTLTAAPAFAAEAPAAQAVDPVWVNGFQGHDFHDVELHRSVIAQVWDKAQREPREGVEVVFVVDGQEYRALTDWRGLAFRSFVAEPGARVTTTYVDPATGISVSDTVVLQDEVPWPAIDIPIVFDQGAHDAGVVPGALTDAMRSVVDQMSSLPDVQVGLTGFTGAAAPGVAVYLPTTDKLADYDEVSDALTFGTDTANRGLDALYASLSPGVSRVDGTKCVVLVTSNRDTHSDSSVEDMISGLREWPAKVFAVVDAGPDGDDYRRIASETGGASVDIATFAANPSALVDKLQQRCDPREPVTADLSVTVDDGRDTVRPGEEVTVTVVVHNSGSELARYAGTVLTLPSLVDIVHTSDSGELYESDTVTSVTWDLNELPPGESRALSVTHRVPVDAPDGTEIEARAEAYHVDVEIEPNPEDNVAYDGTTVVAEQTPGTLGLWYLTNGLAGDPYTLAEGFAYGPASAEVYLGDWDGDGVDTPAYREGNVFHVRNSNTPGEPDAQLAYGRPGDVVYVGDWDGDGVDTFAVRRGNEFFVSNTLNGGEADVRFWYGRADDEVFVGDWDGDGKDTIAIRRGNAFHIRNTLTTGNATHVFWYGRPGEPALVGDWDGNGTDTIAIRRGTQVHVNNSLTTGNATRVTQFAGDADLVLVGDIDGNGTDTLGVYIGVLGG